MTVSEKAEEPALVLFMTEEQKARLRALNARAEVLFASLLPIVDADPIPAEWRFARQDLLHGEYVLALEELVGTYVRFGRALPAEAVPLVRELAGTMSLDPESPVRSLLIIKAEQEPEAPAQ